MKPRFVLTGLGLVLAFALAAAVFGPGASASSATPIGTHFYTYQFEQMHEPWLPHANDMGTPGKVTIAYGENGCPEMQGFHYARLEFSPTREAPSTWLVGSFPGSGLDFVTVKWWSKAFKTETGACENCKVSAYIGDKMPVMSSQFTPVWATFDRTWREFTYPAPKAAITDPLTNDGIIYVALAVSDVAGNFAAPKDAVGFDCAAVTITPTK